MIWSALLGLGALITMVISWPVKRAAYWAALIAAGYFAPTLWWFSDGGFYLFILNIIVDATIFLVIDRYAAEAWEVKLCKIYKASAGTSAVFFGAYIIMRYFGFLSTFESEFFTVYAILLEGFNWAALAIITRTGWTEWYGRLTSLFHGRPDRQTARATLRAPRTSHSWQHK
jgi:hypothetical protein